MRALLCLSLVPFAAMPLSPAFAKPVEIAPSTPWNADYGEGRCRLARIFGEGENRHLLFIDQYGPGKTFGLTVAGPAYDRFGHRQRTALRFYEGQRPFRTAPYTGEVEGFGTGVIYSNVSLEHGTEDKEDEEAPASLPPLDTGLADQTRFIGLLQRASEVRLMTGPLGKAFAELNKCTQGLVDSWGVDAAAHLTATRAARWTNQDAVVRRIQANYPRSALGAGQQGIVRMRVIIDEAGAVERCTLLNVTEADKLQSPACESMREARFEPALDASGQPMRSFMSTSIAYQIGN
ncbi:Gram-negative bacterial tonB protein [Erythrobacter dokdonensis DSW-74]|uniref:Gram-negative bacterial tonB protein n=2 Tax=Erythrobacter TaxID=1041 RepID=A0A1A7BDX3_9SPHN|nr:Gram-negative bacterial tonB protein [Erythrobacter dokdonensis DSW-74]